MTLPIEPVAWQRVKRGHTGAAYVPTKTRNFKNTVKYYASEFCINKLLKGPLRLTVRFILTRPRSITRRTPWKRPDLDNYMKALMDGLNGVLYADDAQIVEYGEGTGKYYAMDGSPGRIELILEEIGPER